MPAAHSHVPVHKLVFHIIVHFFLLFTHRFWIIFPPSIFVVPFHHFSFVSHPIPDGVEIAVEPVCLIGDLLFFFLVKFEENLLQLFRLFHFMEDGSEHLESEAVENEHFLTVMPRYIKRQIGIKLVSIVFSVSK